jgi:gamma-glutamyl:cysteine ligase YbdK (ATP-grasp superfamily)
MIGEPSSASRLRREIEQVLFRTIDPTVRLDGRPMPALTTLLLRVCGDDAEKFEEATRIVELFIQAALENVVAKP